jgi:hypothetical protein
VLKTLCNIWKWCRKKLCNIWKWCRKHFVISGIGVENTVLNIPPWKEVKGCDIRRSWWPGCRTISPNPPVSKCCIQKPTNIWTPVWRGAILLETNLNNSKKLCLWNKIKNYVYIPHNFLLINICNQGKIFCSPCIMWLVVMAISVEQEDFCH